MSSTARDIHSFWNVGSIANVPESYPFTGQHHRQTAQTFTLPSQQYCAAPLYIGGNTPSIVQVGAWISGTTSATMRLGIYGHTGSSNTLPGRLLLDCGTMSLQNAGPLGNSVSFVASANDLLWVVFVTSYGTGTVSLRGGFQLGPLFGVDMQLDNPFSSVSAPANSMSLPATFSTTSVVLGNGAGAEVSQPLIRC